jgi:membrane-bound serine protease (ClpP class)
MRAKIVNDAAAYIRGLAELRGRNADWAEKAVREAASLAAAEAHEMAVVELLAADLDALLRQADGRSVKLGGETRTLSLAGHAVERLEPDWRTALLGVLANPNLAFLLMLIGFYGLLFELISPGAIFPGVIGAVSLLLALYALSVLPVNLAGIALVVLGVALLVAEAFAPSFGALGLGGVVATLIGGVMLFDMDVPGFELSWPAIAAAAALSLALLAAVVWVAARSRGVAVRSGRELMIGAVGIVLEWVDERGRVRLGGEDWRARGPPGLSPGQRVRVAEVRDLTLFVEPE